MRRWEVRSASEVRRTTALNRSRQWAGDDEKERRRRTNMRKDRNGWLAMAVGGGKSGRCTARRATRDGGGEGGRSDSAAMLLHGGPVADVARRSDGGRCYDTGGGADDND